MIFEDFNLEKCADGLLPVIVQDDVTLRVLMLGYMNREAFERTQAEGRAAKKSELESIEAETADQVASLEAKAEKAKVKIDERLLTAYNRIRRSVRNGLAVVTVTRDACGGCYNRIPPQRQVDVRQGKKLIVCEYCGRILVSDNEE